MPTVPSLSKSGGQGVAYGGEKQVPQGLPPATEHHSAAATRTPRATPHTPQRAPHAGECFPLPTFSPYARPVRCWQVGNLSNGASRQDYWPAALFTIWYLINRGFDTLVFLLSLRSPTAA